MKGQPEPKLSAVILAAGFSSRMKDFKPLLPCGDKFMVENTIDLFKKNEIRDIVVVTGHKKNLLEPIVKRAHAVPVFNPDFEQGMLTSVQKGVSRIRPDSDGFFLIPVDIPCIRHHTVRQLIKAFETKENRLVMPYFNGTPGHPPLIPQGMKKDILALQSGCTLRDLFFSRQIRMSRVDVHDRGIVLDADDKKGYRAICEKLNMLDIPDRQECLSIINDHLPETDPIRHHLAQVCMVAVKLAHAVKQDLDTNLIIAAALLHDIKRKEENHAQKGAALLRRIGFDKVADIIDQHMDIDIGQDASVLHEKEIVYFADKLCNGKGLDLNYHKRFAGCLKKSPWAVAGILKRYEHTQQIHARIEASAKRPVEKIFAA